MNIIEVGPTLDTQEYLRKKEQEELDKFFDNLSQNKVEEPIIDSNKQFAQLVSKLNDIECELNIAIELYVKKSKDINTENKEVNEIKKHITYLKRQQTIVTNQINSFITKEG